MDRDERGRLYDGDTVRPPSAPVTHRQLVSGWLIFATFAAAPIIRVIRTLWH